MMALDIQSDQLMMLVHALMEDNVQVVSVPEQVDRFAHSSKNFVGEAIYIPVQQKQTALPIIRQFLEDFQIDPSRFQIISESEK